MASPTIDTPDYQRGAVNAQVLLASIPAATLSETIGVPPNIETLVALIPSGVGGVQARFVGATSGLDYPNVWVVQSPTTSGYTTIFCDVTSVIDEQIDIILNSGPTAEWYVYGDSGTHVVVDALLANALSVGGVSSPGWYLSTAGLDSGKRTRPFLTDFNGQQYVIPTVPPTDTGDHPATELTYYGALFSASGNVLAAPGSGKRYRLFSLNLGCQSGVTYGLVRGGTSGLELLGCWGLGNASKQIPAQGLVLGNNELLYYYLYSGSGGATVDVIYTIETI